MFRLEILNQTPREIIFRIVADHPAEVARLLHYKLQSLKIQNIDIYGRNKIIIKIPLSNEELESFRMALEEVEQEYKEKINEFADQRSKVLNALGPFLV